MYNSDVVSSIRQMCHAAGIRLTPQRLEVFRVLSETGNHPTAESIHQRLRDRMPTVSLDTVYRTLSTFAQLGIVARLQSSNGPVRFDSAWPQHHHFVCNMCGRIEDFRWPAFDELGFPDRVREFGQPAGRHAQIQGICNQCVESSFPAPRPVQAGESSANGSDQNQCIAP